MVPMDRVRKSIGKERPSENLEFLHILFVPDTTSHILPKLGMVQNRVTISGRLGNVARASCPCNMLPIRWL